MKDQIFFQFAQTNRLYSDQIEKNVTLKKQIANQNKEIEELRTNQMSDLPPLRPKLEARVDLTIDSTDEDENLKLKIKEIEGRIHGSSRLGWFTAYLANVSLTKLHDPISPCKSRDRRYPNLRIPKHASES